MLSGWDRTRIADIPADVFQPAAGTWPFALLWLHDEDSRLPSADPVLTAELHSRQLACVAPHAPDSWWLDRGRLTSAESLTPEQHLLDNVIPWMQSRWRQLAVAGVGMGGQGAVRLGLRHPERVPVVASITGAFDFHERFGAGTRLDDLYPSREHSRQDTAILQVLPHDWPRHIWFACPPGHEWYRGNDRLHEKLAAIGVPHVCDLDTHGNPDEFVAPMLTFAVAALEREARRLA